MTLDDVKKRLSLVVVLFCFSIGSVFVDSLAWTQRNVKVLVYTYPSILEQGEFLGMFSYSHLLYNYSV